MTSQAERRSKPLEPLGGTNLSKAGDYNQRVVLQAIRAGKTITRLELAAATGLSHQSAFNICRRLIDDGMVVEVGRTSGGRGQPATRLAVNPEGAFSLGVNIDRDHITLVLMDLAGVVRHRAYWEKRFALPDEVLNFLVASIDMFLAEKIVPRDRIIGLGAAIPDRLGGVKVAERPVDYDQWSIFDFVGRATAELGFAVYRENDATSAAIGEAQFGEGILHRTFIYVLISAGVGCGLIINGRPYAGSLTHAGEIGNVPIDYATGQTGTLWDVVSIYGLFRDLRAKGFELASLDDLENPDPELAEAIRGWVNLAADVMVKPFLAMTYIISPDSYFIGGQLPETITTALCTALNERMANQEGEIPLTRFRPSTTSTDAAAMGGAVLVFQNRLLPRPELLTNYTHPPAK